MLIPFVAVAISTALVYVVYTSKKSIFHVLSEIKYEALFQLIGFLAVYDDIKRKKKNKLEDLPKRTGEVAVVTGGARGIGVEVVKVLLKTGMKVVIGIRTPDNGRQMVNEFRSDNLSTDVDIYELDVSSLKSVKKFASIVSKTYPEISLLVNNAGIMFGDYKLSEDGFESQLATNYLGHFYLTHLLMPNLKRGGDSMEVSSRIVNVSSCAHYAGKIFYDDINLKLDYITSAAYAQSKLAQIMFARHLDAKLESEGSKVRCYSVHPGVVNTDLFYDTPIQKHAKWIMDFFFKTPEEGAISILYTCLSSKLENRGGLYVSNCRQGWSNDYSKNKEEQKRLFDVTCEMVKIKKFGEDAEA